MTGLRLVPPVPLVDTDTVAELKVFGRAGERFSGARLRIEAHMTHPGMAPILADAVDQGQGAYTVRLRFSMAGAWVLYLKGELADRRVVDSRLVEITVRPAG